MDVDLGTETVCLTHVTMKDNVWETIAMMTGSNVCVQLCTVETCVVKVTGNKT